MSTLSSEARALAGAAGDYITEHGWTQGAWGDFYGGPLCMAGAMFVSESPMGTISPLLRHLEEALGVERVSAWNDAEGRTQSEVVGVLFAVEEGWL